MAKQPIARGRSENLHAAEERLTDEVQQLYGQARTGLRELLKELSAAVVVDSNGHTCM